MVDEQQGADAEDDECPPSDRPALRLSQRLRPPAGGFGTPEGARSTGALTFGGLSAGDFGGGAVPSIVVYSVARALENTQILQSHSIN